MVGGLKKKKKKSSSRVDKSFLLGGGKGKKSVVRCARSRMTIICGVLGAGVHL